MAARPVEADLVDQRRNQVDELRTPTGPVEVAHQHSAVAAPQQVGLDRIAVHKPGRLRGDVVT